MKVAELALDRLTPGAQILVEMNSVTVLEGVFQLIEGRVLGVEQSPITSEEMVVDHFRQGHVSNLPVYMRIQRR